MNKKQILIVLSVMSVIFLMLFSCNLKVADPPANDKKIQFEMEKLTSQTELDNLITRGDDNIVDWQLSREFAEIWLENGIEVNRYPSTSQLWDIPIAIYSSDGVIKYYEFRIVDNNNVIGYITGAATKDYSCPILYEGHFDGLYDEITELYNSGILTDDNIPRIVDDLYPNVKIGVTADTRGDSVEFNTYLDIETGDEVNKEDIRSYISYLEALEKYPDMIPEELDHNKMLEMIENDKKQGEEFWNMAVANKGHIADFATRGTAKPITCFTTEESEKRMDSEGKDYYIAYSLIQEIYKDFYGENKKYYEIDHIDPRDFTNSVGGNRLKNYWQKLYSKKGYFSGINNYGPCGPVAAGFIIDFLNTNNLLETEQSTFWNNLTEYEKEELMIREMGCWDVYLFGKYKGTATWPHLLHCSIDNHTPYELKVSGDICCAYSIDNGLPGVSLRLFGENFGHYRPVIGYEKPGWWIFKWYKMKVLDLVDCNEGTEQFKGRWETYVPIHHFASYEVFKNPFKR